VGVNNYFRVCFVWENDGMFVFPARSLFSRHFQDSLENSGKGEP